MSCELLGESPTQSLGPPLETYLLGVVDFEEALQLQRRLVYEIGGYDDGRGALVLCEHLPTITIGRGGSRGHIFFEDDELQRLGIPIRWTNRGGGVMLHLPGQLIAYPVVPLAERGLGLADYLELLHAALLDVLGEFSLRGERPPGQAGIWVGGAQIASVGIAVNRWIAYHGIALNVSTPMRPFQQIRASSFNGGKMTCMAAQRRAPLPMAAVREALIRHLERHLRFSRHHVYSQHALVRSQPRHHVYAESLG